jgi:hypothetical protein
MKMLPRAKIGRLVDHEGDHGHVYKIWMSETGEVKRSRDVTFWEDDDEKPLTPKSITVSTPPPTGNPIHIKFQADETPQREQHLIEDTQKSRLVN